MLTFIHQILEVGLKYNMIADVNFDEALKMAKEWDQKRENGEDTGILGGIPISL